VHFVTWGVFLVETSPKHSYPPSQGEIEWSGKHEIVSVGNFQFKIVPGGGPRFGVSVCDMSKSDELSDPTRDDSTMFEQLTARFRQFRPTQFSLLPIGAGVFCDLDRAGAVLAWVCLCR
jgi:hypothetical protein